VSDRQKLVQKMISNILSIYFSICIICYGILTILIKNRKFSLYYFDLFEYFGEYPEFYYLCLIFCSIFCFRILLIFNHSNSNDCVWIKIIKIITALNGSQSLDSLKIYNKNEIHKYVQKIKTFKFCSQFMRYF
jgi:phosphoglycerol transferase MdoB-like AlkP superfamily enzyme